MIQKKQFGVWMDTQNATIVGTENSETGALVILAQTKGELLTQNSSEKNENNDKRSLLLKYFKEIATNLQNATDVHVTGTGQVQEQFIHYLADTPQFKNTRTGESTSNKMSDEKLLQFFTEKFN